MTAFNKGATAKKIADAVRDCREARCKASTEESLYVRSKDWKEDLIGAAEEWMGKIEEPLKKLLDTIDEEEKTVKTEEDKKNWEEILEKKRTFYELEAAHEYIKKMLERVSKATGVQLRKSDNMVHTSIRTLKFINEETKKYNSRKNNSSDEDNILPQKKPTKEENGKKIPTDARQDKTRNQEKEDVVDEEFDIDESYFEDWIEPEKENRMEDKKNNNKERTEEESWIRERKEAHVENRERTAAKKREVTVRPFAEKKNDIPQEVLRSQKDIADQLKTMTLLVKNQYEEHAGLVTDVNRNQHQVNEEIREINRRIEEQQRQEERLRREEYERGRQQEKWRLRNIRMKREEEDREWEKNFSMEEWRKFEREEEEGIQMKEEQERNAEHRRSEIRRAQQEAVTYARETPILHGSPRNPERRTVSQGYRNVPYEYGNQEQQRRGNQEPQRRDHHQERECKFPRELARNADGLHIFERMNHRNQREEILNRSSFLNRITMKELDIVKFDGNPTKFRNFFISFRDVVLRTCDNDAMKMEILKTWTTGEVREYLDTFSAGDEDFETAINGLFDRYDNHELVVRTAMRDLAKIPPVREDYKKIETTTMKIEALVNELKRRGEQIGIHLQDEIMSKYPAAVAEEIIREKAESRNWNIETLMTTIKKISTRKENERNIRELAYEREMYKTNCVLCGENGHRPINCKDLKEDLTHYNILLANKRCMVCFETGHSTAYCTEGTCRKCGQKHHQIFCRFERKNRVMSVSEATEKKVEEDRSRRPEYRRREDSRGEYRSRSRGRQIRNRSRDNSYNRGRDSSRERSWSRGRDGKRRNYGGNDNQFRSRSRDSFNGRRGYNNQQRNNFNGRSQSRDRNQNSGYRRNYGDNGQERNWDRRDQRRDQIEESQRRSGNDNYKGRSNSKDNYRREERPYGNQDKREDNNRSRTPSRERNNGRTDKRRDQTPRGRVTFNDQKNEIKEMKAIDTGKTYVPMKEEEADQWSSQLFRGSGRDL